MSESLPDNVKEALKVAFEDIDVEHTGAIRKSELRSTLQLIGQNPTAEEMTTFLERAGDGTWTLDEFLTYVEDHVTIKTPEAVDAELMEAFDKFAEGSDFCISREEFRKVMTKIGDEPLSEVDADSLLASLASLETDGLLNIAELSKLFMG